MRGWGRGRARRRSCKFFYFFYFVAFSVGGGLGSGGASGLYSMIDVWDDMFGVGVGQNTLFHMNLPLPDDSTRVWHAPPRGSPVRWDDDLSFALR